MNSTVDPEPVAEQWPVAGRSGVGDPAERSWGAPEATVERSGTGRPAPAGGPAPTEWPIPQGEPAQWNPRGESDRGEPPEWPPAPPDRAPAPEDRARLPHRTPVPGDRDPVYRAPEHVGPDRSGSESVAATAESDQDGLPGSDRGGLFDPDGADLPGSDRGGLPEPDRSGFFADVDDPAEESGHGEFPPRVNGSTEKSDRPNRYQGRHRRGGRPARELTGSGATV